MRKFFVLAVTLLLVTLAGSVFATDQAKMLRMSSLKSSTGEEPAPAIVPYFPGVPGSICQSPGDTIGTTQYDYQANGSTGRRIVVDSQGGLHFIWMWSNRFGVDRSCRYNCFGPTSPWPGVGENIGTHTGYCQIGISNDDRAVCAFHSASSNAESLYAAKDIFSCLGTFYTGHPPNRLGTNKLIWPYITVDRNNRIHFVATSMNYPYMPIGYTRSNNGGSTWTSIAPVDTSRTISVIVVSSKVSDKVAIIYCHPYDTTSLRNDVYYIESPDGITWDNFAGKTNITNYHLNNDSLYAFTEVSAVYDYNDDLHIVWNAQYVSGPVNSIGNGNGAFYLSRAHLYHWDRNSNLISSFASFDSTWPNEGCEIGGWNFVFCKFSVAVDNFPSNRVFVAYTSWDSSDCSISGYANGDIYLQYSTDNGVTWNPNKINMTDSRTPLCEAGYCDSDNWSSLAEYVTDNTLHLFYVNDKDAGESSVTTNPMLYLAFTSPVSVDRDVFPPKNFVLSQNYPNPFNSSTTIEFTIDEPGEARLDVFNLLGQKIITLVDGSINEGNHSAVWDGRDRNGESVTSGAYFYKLNTKNCALTKKMLLLK
jgi:hypothetical protein